MSTDTDFLASIKGGNLEKVREMLHAYGPPLITRCGSLRTLFYALEAGQAVMAKILIENGAGGRNQHIFRRMVIAGNRAHARDVNIDDGLMLNPLAYPIIARQKNVIENIAVQTGGLDRWDSENKTLMQWGAISNDPEIIDVLKKHGANINRRNLRGFYALDEAIFVKLRIAKGKAMTPGFLSSRFWAAAETGNNIARAAIIEAFKSRIMDDTLMVEYIASMGGKSSLLSAKAFDKLQIGFKCGGVDWDLVNKVGTVVTEYLEGMERKPVDS